MATSVKTGSFTLNSSAGSQGITGLGFQPKLVVFWGQELVVNGGHNELRRTFGCAASSTARWATCFATRIGSVGLDQQFTAGRCLLWNDAPTDAEQAGADFTSMDADGFTISVTTGKAVTINYFALGGTDVSVKVGNANSNATDGTTQAITGVGFQPKLMFFSRAPTTTTPGFTGDNNFVVGMATSSTVRATSGAYIEGTVPPTARAFQRTDDALDMIDKFDYNQTSELSSMDADGFTISWGLAGTQATYGYIALGGAAKYAVFNFAQRTTTGTQAVTGTGFIPEAALFFSHGFTASNVLQNGYTGTIGCMDSAGNERAISAQIPDLSSSSSQPTAAASTTKAINVVDSASGTRDAADFSSMDADGFTLSWTTVNGAASQWVGFAVGSSATTTAVSGVHGTTSLGAVTVVAKASTTVSGTAATGSLGTAVASTPIYAINVTATVPGATAALGTATTNGYTYHTITSGLAAIGSVGTVDGRGVLDPSFTTLAGMSMGAIGRIYIELPKFGVLPDFTPNHPNTDADPSQPSRWVNVSPP